MPYFPVAQPSNLPREVVAAVERLERHYLREVHVMLRLPIPNYRLTSSCTFSCAQALLALIGGISTMLYAHRDGNPGKDFKDLMVQFYPWSAEPNLAVTPAEGARIIYHVFRNPLTHNLGVHVRPHPTTPLVKIKRAGRPFVGGGLTERAIEDLERGSRPKMSAAITVRPGDATVLFIEPLYWGVREMLRAVLLDTGRMAKAQTYLAKIT
jgi:hypothetical protein